MDIFNKFSILSYDKYDKIINNFNYKLSKNDLQEPYGSTKYNIYNIFLASFSNVYITNYQLHPRNKPRENDFILLSGIVGLKTTLTNVYLFDDSYQCDPIIDIVYFMLNCIDKNNFTYTNKPTHRQINNIKILLNLYLKQIMRN